MVPVVRTRDLTKRYGRAVGIEALDLDVPGGVVFGCLGPNGAGKTTTLRLLVGLLRPTSGHAEVLGIDVARHPVEVQARIGYLPGDFTAYPDLTAEQYLRYLANLRGGVDWSHTRRLAERFELELGRRIAVLSHGNRQKVGLVQAFMADPELVLLDEPTGGLDPLMQREFLAVVREARDRGRTVILSSHVLSEVEAVADVVAILRRGRLVVVDEIDDLRSRARRHIDLTFAGPPPFEVLGSVAGVRDVVVADSTAHLVVDGSTAELFAALAGHRIDDVVSHEADLEEIFLAHYAEREG